MGDERQLYRFTIEEMHGKQAACGALLAEEQRMPLCCLTVRCFHFRSLSVSSAWCLVFYNFVRLRRVQRNLVCRFLLHRLSQGLVNKREAREGDNGNEHRARAGSDGMEKERKGKLEMASWNVGYFLRLESRSSITPLLLGETRNRAPD